MTTINHPTHQETFQVLPESNNAQFSAISSAQFSENKSAQF